MPRLLRLPLHRLLRPPNSFAGELGFSSHRTNMLMCALGSVRNAPTRTDKRHSNKPPPHGPLCLLTTGPRSA
eukprot:961025-Prorocentrum_minimum.AAC.2